MDIETTLNQLYNTLLTIETKGKTETVTVEDAYRFESDSEHCYRNMGTVLLVFNCFFVTY